MKRSLVAVAAVLVLTGCSQAASPTRQPVATPSAPRTTSTQPATPPPAPAPVVRLAFGGDSYAEGPLEYRLADDPEGFVGPFAEVFRSADVAMVNLETAITTAETPEPKAFNFSTTAAILPALAAGGIDVVSMANNHGMDYGSEGLQDSLRAKRRSAQPVVIGIGGDEQAAYAPYVAEVEGQRVAFFAATHVLDDHLQDSWTAGPGKPGLASAYDAEPLLERIREYRPQVDTVVVYLHWGIERFTCPIDRQIDLTRRLKRAGADVVVGTHAHRVQAGGMMGRAAVHYGLGNFLFQAASAESDRTGVFVVDVQGRDIVAAKWLPGRIADGVPQRLTGADKRAELAYWESLRSCAGLDPFP